MDSLEIQKRIIYEDNHLLIINKPAGILVQGDRTGDESLTESLKQHIKIRDEKPGNVFLAPVHRLDRPVSGVLVFAKTSKAAKRMMEKFKNSEVTKTYMAVVRGIPKTERGKKLKSGNIVGFINKNHKTNIVQFSETPVSKNSKRAELEYKFVEKYDSNHSVLEIHPKTGRSHQIRVSMQHIGCPIKGDLKYGYKHANPDKSIDLYATRIEFKHPVRDELIMAKI